MEPRRSAVAQVVDNLPMHFFKDLSLSAFTAGFVAVLVGFTSSVAIVFQAALALGATPDMVASWMWALGIGMGLCTLLPSLWLKKPVMVGHSIWGIEYPGVEALAAGVLQQHMTIDSLVDALATLLILPEAYAQAQAGCEAFFAEHAGSTAKHMAVLRPWLAERP